MQFSIIIIGFRYIVMGINYKRLSATQTNSNISLFKREEKDEKIITSYETEHGPYYHLYMIACKLGKIGD
jgi:hypothetical protein